MSEADADVDYRIFLEEFFLSTKRPQTHRQKEKGMDNLRKVCANKIPRRRKPVNV